MKNFLKDLTKQLRIEAAQEASGDYSNVHDWQSYFYENVPIINWTVDSISHMASIRCGYFVGAKRHRSTSFETSVKNMLRTALIHGACPAKWEVTKTNPGALTLYNPRRCRISKPYRFSPSDGELTFTVVDAATGNEMPGVSYFSPTSSVHNLYGKSIIDPIMKLLELEGKLPPGPERRQVREAILNGLLLPEKSVIGKECLVSRMTSLTLRLKNWLEKREPREVGFWMENRPYLRRRIDEFCEEAQQARKSYLESA